MQKRVFNISNMSSEQALIFEQERAMHFCYVFYDRRDGTVLNADCPVRCADAAPRWH